ncbi:MAG: cytochrome P450 [Pseudomonadota bacterium]
MSSSLNIEFLDPTTLDFVANPYPTFAYFRDNKPVHWSPAVRAWVVTRYDDVRAVMLDQNLLSDTVTPFYRAQSEETQSKIEILFRYLGNWLVFKDPPDHARIRRLASRVFINDTLQKVRPSVVGIVAHLMDGLEGQKEVDLVKQFSGPLPAYVIMDMLGIPRDQLANVKFWSDEISLFIAASKNTPDKYDRARAGVEAMAAMLQELIDEQRRSPKDNVLGMLVRARDDEDGRLSDDELIATSILFLFAGHETTTNLISMSTLHMLEDPEQRDQFVALDGAEPIAVAIEEFLRFDGPTPSMARLAATDYTIGDVTFEAGQRVYAMLGSANRDPTVFDTPDKLNIARSPNRHVTFGYGAHFCLGAPLARMEAGIALPALHKRYPKMTMADEPQWSDGFTLRGPSSLPLVLQP